MNPSDAVSITQMIISWTLLGVLLAWTLLCAFLALRPLKAEIRETADLPTPSGAYPVLVPQTPLHWPPPSVDLSLEDKPAASIEAPSDADAAPVA